MKNIRVVYTLLLCQLMLCTLHAQRMNFVNISSRLRLPVMETYGVWQDRQGYIWISTETGLCRYDGSELINLMDSPEFRNESVYALTTGPDGTLWMGTSNQRILYYRDKKLQELPVTDAYSKMLTSNSNIIYRLSLPEPHILLIHSYRGLVKTDLRTLRMEIVPGDSTAILAMKHRAQGLLPVNQPRWQAGLETQMKLHILDGKDTCRLQIPILPGMHFHPRLITCRIGKNDYLSYDNKLLCISPDLSFRIYTYPARILSLQGDSEDGLWVGVHKAGLYYYADRNCMEHVQHELDGYSVSGVCEDHEKNIWCSTLEKGVFFCRNKEVRHYANLEGPDKRADYLRYDQGSVFALFEGKRLLEFTSGKVSLYYFPSQLPQNFKCVAVLGDSLILGRESTAMIADRSLRHFRNYYSKGCRISLNMRDFIRDEEGRLIAFGYNAYRNLNDSTTNRCYEKIDLDSEVRTALVTGTNTFYLGCRDGLYRMGPDSMYEPQCLTTAVSQIQALARTPEGYIWMASPDGFYVFDPSAGRLLNVSELLGMGRVFFHDVTTDRYGNVWAASNRGLLNMYRENGSYKGRIFNQTSGLLTGNIFRVAADSNYLYVSSYEGLCRFPLRAELHNSVPPLLYAQELSVNGKRMPLRSRMSFDHDENSLVFFFDVLSFKNEEPVLQYILDDGKQPQIQKIRGSRILFSNLSPGSYTLSVYGLNNQGVKSRQPLRISFEIARPFWLTGWFTLLSLAGISGLSYLIFHLLLRRIRKKEEERTRVRNLIAESQLSALQAQMNPHFVFNAINSIQYYILSQKEDEAYDYLTKFAKLIRMVLNQSRQKTITLQSELESIGLYIELEQLRFRNRFEYRLQVDKAVDVTDTCIPVMLVQPYIENAIRHGFMNAEEGRACILSLDISLHGEYLRVRVQDSGIGRKRSAMYRTEGYHTSVGTILTEERIGMISRMQGYERTHIEISDLYDEDGKAAGTLVEIEIPVQEF
ncbi:MAG: histidine kinase [Bacteroidia bacterium]|nr:histidine kinase [Bacteroidia bacterium]